VRIVAALGIFVAVATGLCPLKTCFDGEGHAPAPAAPGDHGHDDHQGPDRDSGCCVDVPKETGGPWVVVHLDLPVVRCAEPDAGPRTPSSSEFLDAPRVAPARPTVLLR
jgi:hypothetical protein